MQICDSSWFEFRGWENPISRSLWKQCLGIGREDRYAASCPSWTIYRLQAPSVRTVGDKRTPIQTHEFAVSTGPKTGNATRKRKKTPPSQKKNYWGHLGTFRDIWGHMSHFQAKSREIPPQWTAGPDNPFFRSVHARRQWRQQPERPGVAKDRSPRLRNGTAEDAARPASRRETICHSTSIMPTPQPSSG